MLVKNFILVKHFNIDQKFKFQAKNLILSEDFNIDQQFKFWSTILIQYW